MGGTMLSYKSLLWTTGLRNYCDVLIVGVGMQSLALVWSYFRVTEDCDSDNLRTPLLVNEVPDVASDCAIHQSRQQSGCLSIICSVFDVRHVRDVWTTMSKQRPDNGRLIFYLLLVTVFLISLPIFGEIYTLFPFTERLYKWDYQKFSYIQSINQIIRPIATGVYVAFIVKGFSLKDLEISVIGTTSCLVGFLVIASITTEMGFFLLMVASCVGSTANSGIRSFLTKHLPADETSKVLCIILTMEMVQPFIASYVMSSIFRATISSYPTLQFHFAAVLQITSLIILCVMDIAVRRRVSRQPTDRLPCDT
jgi:hypothetical protein